MPRKRTKYFFNPRTLHFEKVRTNVGILILRVVGFVSASLVFGGFFLFITDRYIDSPNEKRLRREIGNLELQMEVMNKRVDQLGSVLSNLQERDKDIYRTIFEADPLSEDIRNAGTGGVEKYKKLEGFDYSTAIIETAKKIDKLSAKMYVQSKSFDELVNLSRNKTEMLASIPAIQPVSNRGLKGMVSGFGYRIHPIYKTRKMHSGCDFAAAMGSPIYATGDGTIMQPDMHHSGYGKYVVISHGYGYQTLYGHMSKVVAQPGQKVKRGQLIGYVGSTGTSTAPHLHYEVIRHGNQVNPINYFFNDLTPAEYNEIREIAEQSNQSFD
jgi:murein DD-endopeptidase MepM/ murein hydrolase activator NlpD